LKKLGNNNLSPTEILLIDGISIKNLTKYSCILLLTALGMCLLGDKCNALKGHNPRRLQDVIFSWK